MIPPIASDMRILSVRDHPESIQLFIDSFSKWWASETTRPVYQNCIENTPGADSPLPQWYLLVDETHTVVIGGAGLITNDFVSRMDLCPWLCALYVEEPYRNNGYGAVLIEHVCAQAQALGFEKVHLCTGLAGYYEKHRFTHVGDGFHPWGEKSRIYERRL